MISLRSYPWLVDHRDERNAKMGTRDLSSSSSENVTKRLWFSIKCILFSRKFYQKIVRRLFFLVLWSTIFVYRVSDLFKASAEKHVVVRVLKACCKMFVFSKRSSITTHCSFIKQ